MKRIKQTQQAQPCRLVAAVENTSAYAPAFIGLEISTRLIEKITAAKAFIESQEDIERVGISALGEWDGLGTGTGSITHIDTDGQSIVVHGIEPFRQTRFHTEPVTVEQLLEATRKHEDLVTPDARGYTAYAQEDDFPAMP